MRGGSTASGSAAAEEGVARRVVTSALQRRLASLRDGRAAFSPVAPAETLGTVVSARTSFTAVASAPRASRSATHAGLPYCAAKCNGRRPSCTRDAAPDQRRVLRVAAAPQRARLPRHPSPRRRRAAAWRSRRGPSKQHSAAVARPSARRRCQQSERGEQPLASHTGICKTPASHACGAQRALLAALTSAPRSSSSATTPTWPRSDAQHSGVSAYCASRPSTLAPPSSAAVAAVTSPTFAASHSAASCVVAMARASTRDERELLAK